MKLKDISDLLLVPYEGDGTIIIEGLSEPKTSKRNQLALAMDKKFVQDLDKGEARTAIVMEGTDWKALGLDGALFVKQTRYTIARLSSLFEEAGIEQKGLHPSAIISDSAKISDSVSIGPFSVIGSDVELNDNTIIGSHVSIGKSVTIGKGAIIHSGVRIGSNVVIGDGFICHSNAVIGSDGFSFVSPDGGGVEQARKERSVSGTTQIDHYVRIASLGSVVIGNDVEIGAGSIIDRGTIENTTVGNGTKLDNLVHLGHNVTIGDNCLLCGQVGVAGSAKIGNRVVLGGQVGVSDHISIGNDSIIAGKSGVFSNVPVGRFMMGNPATKIENNIDSYKSLRRLPKALKRIEKLEQLLSKNTG